MEQPNNEPSKNSGNGPKKPFHRRPKPPKANNADKPQTGPVYKPIKFVPASDPESLLHQDEEKKPKANTPVHKPIKFVPASESEQKNPDNHREESSTQNNDAKQTPRKEFRTPVKPPQRIYNNDRGTQSADNAQEKHQPRPRKEGNVVKLHDGDNTPIVKQPHYRPKPIKNEDGQPDQQQQRGGNRRTPRKEEGEDQPRSTPIKRPKPPKRSPRSDNESGEKQTGESHHQERRPKHQTPKKNQDGDNREKKPKDKPNKERKPKDNSDKEKKPKDNTKKREKRPKENSNKENNSNKQNQGYGRGGRKRTIFVPYLSPEEIKEGLKNKTLYEGKIRINPHNRQEAYVTVQGFDRDVKIRTAKERNRAFDGDTVIVEIYPESQWQAVGTTEEIVEDILNDEVDGDGEFDRDSEMIDKKKLKSAVQKEESESETESESEGESDSEEEEESEEDSVHPQKEEKFEAKVVTKEKPADQKTVLDVSNERVSAEKREMAINNTTPVKPPPSPTKATEESSEKTSRELQPTGRITSIEATDRLTEHVGYLQPANPDKGVTLNDKSAIFVPMDVKVPRIIIPIAQIPGYYKDFHSYDNKLVSARIRTWKENSMFPYGTFIGLFGEAGEINAETLALLKMHRVDYSDFSANIMEDLPEGQYKIPASEFQNRRDLREERIFTIDPSTAKDLDDALHIKKISDDVWEVGVHIADVSFFVKPGTALDKEASKRATTVYLVQKAIPMLPHILCENLCSLNPGVDRLAFSVIWNLTSRGEILKEWFGRSVIRSCSKMAYDVAQGVIENGLIEDWVTPSPSLGPYGPHTVRQIAQDILNMHSIAQHLRKGREENGALSMTNSKISFRLDDLGNPIETFQYITKEANHMIEEFMLLANQRVAVKISSEFPDIAMLRNHASPKESKLDGFKKVCKNLGTDIDISSGRAMRESLIKLKESFSPAIFQALQILGTKSMQLAKYFCTGDLPESEWRHYALNVDHYTHFTSPIRRYPDIVVHRLLDACLDPIRKENRTGLFNQDKCGEVAEHCNEKKLLARRAQEASSELFLKLLIIAHPHNSDAVVLSLGERFITCIVPTFNQEMKIWMEDLPIKESKYNEKTGILHISWPQTVGDKKDPSPPIQQDISCYSLIPVRVVVQKGKLRLETKVELVHPSEIKANIQH